MGNLWVATILIADYDARTRERCSARLNAGGFNVMSAAEGRDALETAVAARPDIVSATIFLPAISGVDLCRRLKRDPRTTKIRVILHSSTALLPGQCRQAREAGCDALLVQPRLPEALFDKAQEFLPDPATLSPRSHMLRCLYNEYLAMPTLRLTREQIQRLLGVSETLCRQLLESLVQGRFLCRTADDHYMPPPEALQRLTGDTFKRGDVGAKASVAHDPCQV